MDRCERTNENGESTFWEEHWLKRSIKKREVFFLVHKNDAKHTPPPKKKSIYCKTKKKMEERRYENILMEVLLELLFDRMTKEEMDLLRDQLVEFSNITVHYLMDLKNRVPEFDYTKIPHMVETGWRTFKLCPMTLDEEERKRVSLKIFDDYVNESNMEEVSQSFAER